MARKLAPAAGEPPTVDPAASPESTEAIPAAAPAAPEVEPDPPVKEKRLFEFVREGDDAGATTKMQQEISAIVAKHEVAKSYRILFLYDDVDSITGFHADRLYAAASNASESSDILLILHSGGGSIESAYLISKALKRLSKNKFAVVVPRRAKSAATLLALGADEIHMGMMSQLGPIDPQIGGLPVLAVGNAMESIAQLAGRHPSAAEMLTKYLVDQAPLRILGYYNRVAESAVQYAERLLEGKTGDKTPHDAADHLVNHYKDHGFVIDVHEARNLLGDGLVKEGTLEYKLGDAIYRQMRNLELFLSMKEKCFWWIGTVRNGLSIQERQSS